jgi:hypothetical protein
MAEILFRLKENWAEKLTEIERENTAGAVFSYRCGAIKGYIYEVQEDGYFQTRTNPTPPARGWGGGEESGNMGLIRVAGKKKDFLYLKDRCHDSFTSKVQTNTVVVEKYLHGNMIRPRYMIDFSLLPAPDIWKGTTVTKKPFERHIYTIIGKLELIDRDDGIHEPEEWGTVNGR